uniref:AB hydrolase-1 domain-containing protein n=1 Tax=Lactuca sativa TaxID=4236 RepID=A0A9R1V705_LACSA|nr:hypothetical protein LSAT_V11C600307980 [Lactuca sativa]
MAFCNQGFVIMITEFECLLYLGNLKKVLLVFCMGFSAWAYRTALPPLPKMVGSPGGPSITSPRIKLRDGRHLSYIESGALVEELGVYFVAIDRPGYGESDPDPKRTVKSLAFDIEEVADHLNLGPKFYVAGYSMGGQVVWSCLKYIRHRLSGAVLIAPAVNYWWPHLPLNLTNEAFSRQLPQDQWSLRVAHYLPWLSYWWNTQKWFPSFSIIDGNHAILSPPDIEASSKLFGGMNRDQKSFIFFLSTIKLQI